MEIPGDRIREELTRAAQFVVCRGEAADGTLVLLKVPVSPDPAAVASLRRERELLEALDLEGLPRVRGMERQSTALVLEDIGATPLRAALKSGPFLLPEFFEMALELAQTVGELHRRRVVHKSLSPDSILLNARTKRTQVLDFSLASRLSQETQPPSPPRLLPRGWATSRRSRPAG